MSDAPAQPLIRKVPPRRSSSRGARSGGTDPAVVRRRILLLGGTLMAAIVLILLLGGGGPSAAERLGGSFVRAWANSDWARMYSQVDAPTRRRMTVSEFAGVYRHDWELATAISVQVGRSRRSGELVTVPVAIRTRLFGLVRAVFAVPIDTSGATDAVAWRPSLAFPGLRPGEALSRHTTLPPRAPLLARNGVRLGSVPAASGIVGSLGPIPPDLADELRSRGYPPDAQVGINGLERIFDARLAGTPGGELLAGGRIIGASVARAGSPVRTTISPRLQALAVATLGGMEGGIVMMRPRSGELLAVAGTPFSGLQPPGSTFKIVTLTGILLAGLATPSSTFPYATTSVIDGYTLHNANDESCGGSLATAFATSCNSVFAPLGAKLGANRLVDAARRFGFNQPPPLPGVAESTIPRPGLSSALDVGSSAIGQGQVQATALQMAVVAATIANRGLRPTPTLAFGSPRPAVRVLPGSVAGTIARMMVGVVAHGTGTAARISGVRVAGKTGTAELANTVKAGDCTPDPANPQACPTPHDPRNTDAWFVAFAPAAHPRVTVGILLPHNGAGGDTAAPLAAVLLRAALMRI